MRMIKRLIHSLVHTVKTISISDSLIKTFIFYFDAFGPEKTQATSVFRLGALPFAARYGDWVAVHEITIEKEYNFLSYLIKDASSPVIIDVGANIGLFALYSLLLNPRAHVISVEPSADTYALLCRNKELNPGFHWDTHRYALWLKEGTVRFTNQEYSTNSSIGAEKGNEEVPAITLPALIKNLIPSSIDIAKIDIEGAEEAVLCGNESVLKGIRNLIIEVHPAKSSLNKIISSLRSVYPFIYEIHGRVSKKPLLLATHVRYPLPEYAEK